MTDSVATPSRAQEVLDFWFAPEHAAHWFARSAGFDAEIRLRFDGMVGAASTGDPDDWTRTPAGWLALLIVLDQFRRNLYRDDVRAWLCDERALTLALGGIARGDDQRLPLLQRPFAYLPLEHAEDRVIQARSVALFEALEAAAAPEQRMAVRDFLESARRHRQVVDRFGRFPHRNAWLGRDSTPAELVYLAEPGAGF